MSWEFVKNTYPVARKEHDDDSGTNFKDFGVIVKDHSGSYVASEGNLNDVEIEPGDMAVILEAANNGFKINAGEQYIRCEGKIEGEFMTWRSSFKLNELIKKYGLYYED